MRRHIDFNCDLGEGCDSDAALMPFISSASIACGGHAGDANSMRTTVQLCIINGVAAGAHPSYPDREHFGRRSLPIESPALFDAVAAQLRRLREIATEFSVPLRHVKAHGALYNDLARGSPLCEAYLDAVAAELPGASVMALAGSAFAQVAARRGFVVRQEAFIERGYMANGGLAPRGGVGAVHEDLQQSLMQLRDIVSTNSVRAIDGLRIPVHADTLCLHGDRPDALAFATAVRRELDVLGIQVKA